MFWMDELLIKIARHKPAVVWKKTLQTERDRRTIHFLRGRPYICPPHAILLGIGETPYVML